MAKGNMLQGQATGKVGDIVFMVRNGQQVARVYTSAGGRSGDQASIAVRRQRVRFGAASNQYLLYRNIVRGMYRTGKSTKQSDYNFFVRENVDLLPYLTRDENAAGVKCAMPGTFARGTLGQLVTNITFTKTDDAPWVYKVTAAGQAVNEEITWASRVEQLKAVLKVAFPNARKVTYSVIKVIPQSLEIPSGTQYSHTFVRCDVVFDLFEADPIIGDGESIANYFGYYTLATQWGEQFLAMTGTFCENNELFKISTEDADAQDILSSLYVLVYATNDQVGDCYTSTLASITAPKSSGGLTLYDDLRTDDHRQVAEDSYGYATGVMRTNIQQA